MVKHFDRAIRYEEGDFGRATLDSVGNPLDLLFDGLRSACKRLNVEAVPRRAAARCARLSKRRFQLALSDWIDLGALRIRNGLVDCDGVVFSALDK